jgi:RNA polymerase sigma factor (sigma-70 family)
MTEHDWLAQRFEENRAHLRSVAYRLLGSGAEADDAVQEAWLRLSRSDTSDVENLRGWLTTVVARVSLDILRSRKTKGEESLDEHIPGALGALTSHDGRTNPEHEAIQADSIGIALLVILETLTPAERLSFVLHDMFGVSFEEIAPIVERTPTAARQLASRARRRVQGQSPSPDAEFTRRREIVHAFLAAARDGQFEALLSILDPDVILRADATAIQLGASSGLSGATAVATNFSGRARAARPVLVDGVVGAAWAPGGRPRSIIHFTIVDGKITEIHLRADDDHLEAVDLVFLDEYVRAQEARTPKLFPDKL